MYIPDSAFGVYNAVTEYLDHQAPLAGGKVLTAEEAAIRRAHRALTSVEMASMKVNTMDALLAL